MKEQTPIFYILLASMFNSNRENLNFKGSKLMVS